jgi:hypothetical protein
MAIVKVSYTRRAAGAKASIRYLAHRPTAAGHPVARQLFGTEGAMRRHDAYHLIDEAGRGSVFFRIVISPDPTTEDTSRDLHLRLVTEETMAAFSRDIDSPVPWVAAVHDDHSPHRHVHVLAAVTRRIEPAQLQTMREQATRICQLHRAELDRGHIQERHREEAVWDLQR